MQTIVLPDTIEYFDMDCLSPFNNLKEVIVNGGLVSFSASKKINIESITIPSSKAISFSSKVIRTKKINIINGETEEFDIVPFDTSTIEEIKFPMTIKFVGDFDPFLSKLSKSSRFNAVRVVTLTEPKLDIKHKYAYLFDNNNLFDIFPNMEEFNIELSEKELCDDESYLCLDKITSIINNLKKSIDKNAYRNVKIRIIDKNHNEDNNSIIAILNYLFENYNNDLVLVVSKFCGCYFKKLLPKLRDNDNVVKFVYNLLYLKPNYYYYKFEADLIDEYIEDIRKMYDGLFKEAGQLNINIFDITKVANKYLHDLLFNDESDLLDIKRKFLNDIKSYLKDAVASIYRERQISIIKAIEENAGNKKKKILSIENLGSSLEKNNG